MPTDFNHKNDLQEEISVEDKLKKLEELWEKEKEFLDSIGIF